MRPVSLRMQADVEKSGNLPRSGDSALRTHSRLARFGRRRQAGCARGFPEEAGVFVSRPVLRVLPECVHAFCMGCSRGAWWAALWPSPPRCAGLFFRPLWLRPSGVAAATALLARYAIPQVLGRGPPRRFPTRNLATSMRRCGPEAGKPSLGSVPLPAWSGRWGVARTGYRCGSARRGTKTSRSAARQLASPAEVFGPRRTTRTHPSRGGNGTAPRRSSEISERLTFLLVGTRRSGGIRQLPRAGADVA